MTGTINSIEKVGFDMRIVVTYNDTDFAHEEVFEFNEKEFESMSNQDIIDKVANFGTRLIKVNEKETSYKDLLNHEFEVPMPEGSK